MRVRVPPAVRDCVVWRRPFFDVFVAQFLTELADQLFLISVTWALLGQQSGTRLGVVLTAWAVPRGLFLLFGGVIIDRTERRALGIAAATGIAIVVFVLAAATATHHATLALWIGAAITLGLLDGVRIPIGYSLIPLVVPERDVLDANRWSQLRLWATLMLGPALGGVLVGFTGVTTSLVVIGTCYLCGGLTLIRLPRLAVDREDHDSVIRDLAAGFRLIRRQRTLRLLLPVFAAVNLFVLGVVAVGIPTLVKTGLHGDAKALGLMTGSFGVGLMLGTVLMRKLPGFLTGTLGGLFVLFALSDGFLALTGLAPALPAAAVTFALSGFFIGPASATYQSILQTTTPPEYLGRVISTSRAISFGLEPASASLVGFATRLASAAVVVVVGGFAATCIDVAAAIRGRMLDRAGVVALPGTAATAATAVSSETTGSSEVSTAEASASTG